MFCKKQEFVTNIVEMISVLRCTILILFLITYCNQAESVSNNNGIDYGLYVQGKYVWENSVMLVCTVNTTYGRSCISHEVKFKRDSEVIAISHRCDGTVTIEDMKYYLYNVGCLQGSMSNVFLLITDTKGLDASTFSCVTCTQSGTEICKSKEFPLQKILYTKPKNHKSAESNSSTVVILSAIEITFIIILLILSAGIFYLIIKPTERLKFEKKKEKMSNGSSETEPFTEENQK